MPVSMTFRAIVVAILTFVAECCGYQPLDIQVTRLQRESFEIDGEEFAIVFAVVNVTNRSSESVMYAGMESDEPLFVSQKRRRLRWVRFNASICGTGSSTYVLKPGDNQEMSIPIGYVEDIEPSKYRVGFHWEITRSPEDVWIPNGLAWSNAVKLPQGDW